MKRDNELRKPSHILAFDEEKGKATCIENVWCPKSQRLNLKIEISKISGIDQNEMFLFLNDHVMKEAKRNASMLCNQVL